MEEIIGLVYTVWAIYVGYKFVSHRSAWLDRREPINLAVKFLLSVCVGYVIAAFYLVYLLLMLIRRFIR